MPQTLPDGGYPYRYPTSYPWMHYGMSWDMLTHNPIFWVVAIFWIAVHILFFLILLFIAIYLWRKIKNSSKNDRKK